MYADRRNSAFYRKSGPRNTVVTSDFRPEVGWPYRACAMKNMQYYPEGNVCRNSSVIVECGLGHGAHTTFHRTYFYFSMPLLEAFYIRLCLSGSVKL